MNGLIFRGPVAISRGVPLLDGDDAADARPDDHAAAIGIEPVGREVDPTVQGGFDRGVEAEGAESVHPLELTMVDPRGGIPIADFAGDADGPFVVLLEGGDGPDAGAAFEHRPPHRPRIGSEVGHGSEAGDDDSPHGAAIHRQEVSE
jgi:hypothetical protein